MRTLKLTKDTWNGQDDELVKGNPGPSCPISERFHHCMQLNVQSSCRVRGIPDSPGSHRSPRRQLVSADVRARGQRLQQMSESHRNLYDHYPIFLLLFWKVYQCLYFLATSLYSCPRLRCCLKAPAGQEL